MKSFPLLLNGRTTARGFACLLALGSPTLLASPPDAVLVFGDSAADQGNLNATPGYEPGPHAPYYRGSDGLQRLSDGPMWTERLYPAIHSINAPGDLGRSVNFAYGAATTGPDTIGAGPAGELPVGVQSQVDAYLALRAADALPAPTAGTYAFIEAGPNDYFAALDRDESVVDVASASPARLADSTRRLLQAGIRTIFVTETPDFAESPLFIDAGIPPATRDEFSRIAALSRTNLRTELAKIQAEAGSDTHVVVMPVNHLFRAILAHPAAFGFTDVQGKIYDDTTDTILETDPAKRAGYLFVDSLHTTAKAQDWQARYYAEVIGAIDGTAQRRLARVTDGLRHDADLLLGAAGEAMAGPTVQDRWTWFVGARGGSAWGAGEVDSGPGWRSDALGSLAGARRQVTKNWTLGLGLSSFDEQGKLSPATLRWKNQGVGLWVLNTWDLAPVTVRFNLGASTLDSRTTRDPSIPTFVARGDTDGYLLMSRFEVERPLGSLTSAIDAGLVLGTTFSRSHLKGFDETGAAGLNLRVGELERDSIRSDAGLRFRASGLRLGTIVVEPSADFLVNYEAGDRSTPVSAQLLDNSAAAVRESVPHGSRTQGAVRFNLGFVFSNRLRAQLSDVVECSSSDRHEHRLELGLTANF
jgi:phospholipase/lecithinase/hemolysin